jgi:hypothetical protein
MSLGAYVTALWASLDRLDKIALMVPLLSMGDMAFDLLQQAGSSDLSRDFIQGLFVDHYPLNGEPVTPQDSMMVVAGTGDHLVPQSQISQLQSRWPRANVLWVGGGHAAATNRTEAFDKIATFLLS